MAQILKGIALVDRLRVTRMDVKVIAADGMVSYMPVHMAMKLAAGGLYEGGAVSSRVKYIREVDPRVRLPWQKCWRTASAAVCAPSYGYDRRTRGGFAA